MSNRPKGFRKRVLVNEMDLFNLYADIKEIRDQERSKICRKDFRKLLKEAEFVSFAIEPKKEGGNHEC